MKMDLKKCIILITTMSLCYGTVVENYEKNISCNDIKTNAGFNFSHNGNECSEISVIYNKTVIAYALPGKQSFQYSSVVISIDNYSIIMRDCRDLAIKCIVPDGKFVKESRIHYRITDKAKNLHPSNFPTLWIIITAMCLACGVALGLSWYFCTKKNKKQHSADDQAMMQTTMGSEITSTPGPVGSGENHTEQDDTLESVLVDSGETSASDNDRASTHRAMHRSLRDDPGGVNNKGGLTLSTVAQNGLESEGQPMLWNQRADIQAFDTKGGAADLVNKCEFDQHQVSRCPTAPLRD